METHVTKLRSCPKTTPSLVRYISGKKHEVIYGQSLNQQTHQANVANLRTANHHSPFTIRLFADSQGRRCPMKTSIILPTYKEKDNIVELVQAIFATLQPDNLDFEIIVVDDNSPDGTAEVVRQSADVR